MKQLKILVLIISLFFSPKLILGAYLKSVPIVIFQPDGQIINCYITGDEFYSWLHDKNGYTIIQDQETGYYCYAIFDKNKLEVSPYVVGTIIPELAGLIPNINISHEKIMAKMKTMKSEMFSETSVNSQSYTDENRILNNLVIYISFADQNNFTEEQPTYTSLFNDITLGTNSLKNYYLEASYGKLEINTTFYPINNGVTILSYKDVNSRDYYRSYSVTNPMGYSDEIERKNREHTLLHNALNYVKNQIPISLNIDTDSDGKVDNVCFIIKGNVDSGILWPHYWILTNYNDSINGAKVYGYNLQLDAGLMSPFWGNGVLAHEMFHSLGAPDLYHYNGDNMQPVGIWDVMDDNQNPPQHMGAYMKYKYGKWIDSIPEINVSGTYSLNSLTSGTNNCYKIPIPKSSTGIDPDAPVNFSKWFIVVEYRKNMGVFEESLPNSGLLIYKISAQYNGNSNGIGPGGVNGDEVYVYRMNGNATTIGIISKATFSELEGRMKFSKSTNPYSFFNANQLIDVYIENIRTEENGTINFDICFCDNIDVIYSNTDSMPSITNATNDIKTYGNVKVKPTDSILFEAGNEVFLNEDFEIKAGGIFEIKIRGCGLTKNK